MPIEILLRAISSLTIIETRSHRRESVVPRTDVSDFLQAKIFIDRDYFLGDIQLHQQCSSRLNDLPVKTTTARSEYRLSRSRLALRLTITVDVEIFSLSTSVSCTTLMEAFIQQ